jgi:hypothetical protein
MPFFSGFNPFNPWHVLEAMRHPPPIYPVQPRVPAGTPIEIKPRNSDPGARMTAGKDSVTISGTTKGAQVVRDSSGWVKYEVARGMSFTLDIDKAPTEDIFGRTNYTEKNSRLFTLDTSVGWSAAECARRLADKVNKGDDFRAKVTVEDDGSATIHFSRR